MARILVALVFASGYLAVSASTDSEDVWLESELTNKGHKQAVEREDEEAADHQSKSRLALAAPRSAVLCDLGTPGLGLRWQSAKTLKPSHLEKTTESDSVFFRFLHRAICWC